MDLEPDYIRRKEAAINVYILSVLLSQIQHNRPRKMYTRDSCDGASKARGSSMGKTLNRLAILLSRGTKAEQHRDITVVTGPLTADGLKANIIISVSPSSTARNESLSTDNLTVPLSLAQEHTQPRELSSAFDSLVVNQNSASSPALWEATIMDRVGNEDVELDSTDSDATIFHPAEKYSFPLFTKTLLLVVRASTRRHEPRSAAYFAMSQCCRKALSRTKAVRRFFKVAGLRDWCPVEGEVIVPQNAISDTPALHRYLSGHRIVGHSIPSMENFWMYTFDSSNCHLWLRGLLAVIEAVYNALNLLDQSQRNLGNNERFVEDCKRHTITATEASNFLHLFLLLIPHALWNIPSLNTILQACSRGIGPNAALPPAGGAEALADSSTHDHAGVSAPDDAVPPVEDAPRKDDNIEEDLTSWTIPEDWQTNQDGEIVRKKWRINELGEVARKNMSETLLPGCLRFVRAVDAITAWTTAAVSLSNSRFAKSTLPLDLTVYDLPHQVPEDISMNVVEHVADRWIASSPYLRLYAEKAKAEITAAWNVANTHGQAGSCHCEAGIMANMAARSPKRTVNAPAEFPLLELGVAKKSCPFCTMLEDVLQDHYAMSIKLPGSHTTYFPWFPPATLTTDVLLALERKASRKLIEMLQYSANVVISNASSPTSSDGEDDGAFVPDDKRDYVGWLSQ